MSENVVRQLRGDDVGRAILAALPCTRESPATVDVEIDVNGFGRVRFTLGPFRNDPSGSCYWRPKRAVRA